MEIQLILYGSSKMLSDKDTLNIQLPDNSNIEKLRNILNKIISKKHLKSNLEKLLELVTSIKLSTELWSQKKQD